MQTQVASSLLARENVVQLPATGVSPKAAPTPATPPREVLWCVLKFDALDKANVNERESRNIGGPFGDAHRDLLHAWKLGYPDIGDLGTSRTQLLSSQKMSRSKVAVVLQHKGALNLVVA